MTTHISVRPEASLEPLRLIVASNFYFYLLMYQICYTSVLPEFDYYDNLINEDVIYDDTYICQTRSKPRTTET